MQVLRDYESIASVPDLHLRALLEKCVASLTTDFDEYDLDELVTFIVIEPGDSLAEIDTALGFPILTRPFELLVDHADWYELVFIVSDDGYGIEVFISKASGVDPRLLSMCARHVETTR
jgi:hypothetical protein